MHTSRRDPHVKESAAPSTCPQHLESRTLAACLQQRVQEKYHSRGSPMQDASLQIVFLQPAFSRRTAPRANFNRSSYHLASFVLLTCQRRRMALACLVSPEITSSSPRSSPHVFHLRVHAYTRAYTRAPVAEETWKCGTVTPPGDLSGVDEAIWRCKCVLWNLLNGLLEPSAWSLVARALALTTHPSTS